MPQQDYATAAAAVLTQDGHDNAIYELSGNLMTQEEFAAVLGDVLGKEVQVQQVDDAAYADIMAGAGLPEFLIPMLVNVQQGIREGTLDVESQGFEKLLGRPVTPLKEGLTQLVETITAN